MKKLMILLLFAAQFLNCQTIPIKTNIDGTNRPTFEIGFGNKHVKIRPTGRDTNKVIIIVNDSSFILATEKFVQSGINSMIIGLHYNVTIFKLWAPTLRQDGSPLQDDDIWIDISHGNKKYVRSGNNWVDASDASLIPLYTSGTSMPSSPKIGDLNFYTGVEGVYHSNTLYEFNGDSWDSKGLIGTYIDGNGIYTHGVYADQIIAGDGFINNLSLLSTLTIGSSVASGYIKSYDYSTGVSGWEVGKGIAEFNKAKINGGSISIGLGAPFRVDSLGNLKATSATISGALTTGNGSSIDGQFINSISANKITAGTGIISDLSIISNITVGTTATNGTIKSYGYVPGATGWKIGNNIIELNGGNINGTIITGGSLAIGHGNPAPFRVDEYGNLTATSATIAGYALTSDLTAYQPSLGIARLDDIFTNSYGVLSVRKADNSQGGYLSPSDWTTFNNKLSSESDPIFSASVAHGITAADVSDWGSKQPNLGISSLDNGIFSVSYGVLGIYPAGTSRGGYLSSSDWNNFNNKLSSESDPIFSASVAHGITAADVSDWGSKQPNLGISSLDNGIFSVSYGVLGIYPAGTSRGGYLSSSDWNTFKGKASMSDLPSAFGSKGSSYSGNMYTRTITDMHGLTVHVLCTD